MKKSKYQLRREEPLIKQAIELYKQGLPIRVVAAQIGKNRMWVWRRVQKRLPGAVK